MSAAARPGRAPAATPWPALREELQLHEAGQNRDGSPAWHIADPVRNQFVRIGWLEFEMLRRWALADAKAIAASIAAETALAPSAADVDQFVEFLRRQSLLRQVQPGTGTGRYGWRWWLRNYLFLRIPLLRPTQLLNRLAPRVGWLYTRWFVALTVVAAVAGAGLAARQWDVVVSSLRGIFTWEGGIAFFAALAFSKLVHEFSHALAATRRGIRVGHMGIALIVLFPMAYTDTGESWKLMNARQRLAIASAGIIAELVLAAWCTLLWMFLPDGGLKQAVFFLATTAWVWTLAINASPFMRFDGYFILSDLLDFPGLHERAGGLARRWLRRALLGLDEPLPENLPPGFHRGLIAFALITWLYRLVVFLGIALLVYHVFFKLLGIALFIVEIWVFIARPVYSELKVWWMRRSEIPTRVRWRWAALASAVLLVMVIPWPTRVSAPGVLRAASEQAIYAPYAARLEALKVVNGDRVEAGQVVAELFAPRQAAERSKATAAAEGYGRAAGGALGFEYDGAARQVMAERQRTRWLAEISARDAELARLHVAAESSGWVYDVDPTVKAGNWINASTPLAWVVHPGRWRAEIMVAEKDRGRLEVGGKVTIVVHGRTQVLSGRIIAIDNARVQRLPHMLLAAPYGGPLAVLPGTVDEGLRPAAAVYRVLVEGEGDEDRPAIRLVHAHLEATGESAGWRWLATGLSVLIQQSGF
ncbi:MAG: HlyD family efflux transporter periplasmic adaptor subunit [Luteimonas sp.]|nr:HlyD family efflux transporter periplasmic adaptor subunit [Luteimonas sp.]